VSTIVVHTIIDAIASFQSTQIMSTHSYHFTAIAIAWVVALRFFAKPIVILVELCKIAIFVVMGIYQQEAGTRVICFLIAAAFVAYDIWARDKLMFAAKMITHSTIAMKENPVILFGGIFIKLLFAANAALFIFFFCRVF
jgi:hypothetical protein